MKEFFQSNRLDYLKNVNDGSLSVYFSGIPCKKSGDQNFPFQINNNFYYLTGINKPNMILMMGKGAKVTKEYLFIEAPSEYAALWFGAKMTKEEASALSGINAEDIYYLEDFQTMLSRFLQISRGAIFGFIKEVYLDLEREGYLDIPSKGNEFALELGKKYPSLLITNGYNILCVLRTYKKDYEISEIEKAIDITNQGIKSMMVHSHSNMKECELESYFAQMVRYHDSTYAFNTIAASGIHGTVLHYDENNSMMKPNDLVLFDLGAQSNHYCADITRTFPVDGKFTERQKEVYNVVLECNKKCIEFLKPGVTSKEYNDYAKQLLAAGCKRLGLIKDDSELSRYYYHSIGHFLGLDTHDVGEYVTPFKEGVVITCEPGLYIHEEGIGIRIEDDVLITKNGSVCLSSDVIKEVSEIEDFFTKYNTQD